MRLVKGNITGISNATSNWIPTTTSLMLRVITKEDTLDRLCHYLCPLMRLEKNKDNTTKGTKVAILRQPTS
jgi:hypothetical protein